ncbi:MAG: hypothetical protein ACHRXM_33825 [Isosphaerales bacterium]
MTTTMQTSNGKHSPPGELDRLNEALRLLKAGYWTIAIYPPGRVIGNREPTKGKEPIGREWGLTRWTPGKLRRAFADYPGAGAGICFGPGRSPGDGWLIDIEGDGPQADQSRERLFGGEIVGTIGWTSARGCHDIFDADGERLLKALVGAGSKENGMQPGVYHLDALPGLEFRIGGYKADGKTIKQLQSVVPPTIGTDGKPRKWKGPDTLASLPESAYTFLEGLAESHQGSVGAIGKVKPTSSGGQRATPTGPSLERRAIAYINTMEGAVSGKKGHDKAFRAACRVGPGFDLPPDVAFRLLWKHYNPRCVPRWSETEMRHKVDDAYKEEPRRGFLRDQKRTRSNAQGPPSSGNEHAGGNGDGHEVPDIEINTKRHIVLDETIRAVANDPDLYGRGETLGIVYQEKEDTAKLAGGVELRNARGSLRFIPLAQSVLGCRLTRHANFWRLKKIEGEDTDVDCHPPDWLISAVADHRYWPGVRELLSIAEVPYVLADGSLASPGFDRRTGTLYRPSVKILRIPDRPTLKDAKDACGRLFSPVEQFPFEDDNNPPVWLANLLTAIQRPAIRGPVPGFAYNGNKAGCGKGLLIDIVGNIVWGRNVSTRAYPMDPVEADKVKLALALAAIPIVHFDNLPEGGFYGGSTMDSAITSTITSGRILGLSRDSGDVPIRPVWTLSGNNISPMGDGDRRWLPIDLVTQQESPHERKDIEVKNLRDHVIQHRAELLRDCYLILRAHALAGRPTDGWGALGTFEEWDPVIRGAAWWVTGVDCLTTQRKRAKEMPDRLNKTALLQGWKELDPGGKGKTAQEALEALDKQPEKYPILKSALLGISKDGKLPNVNRIGAKLRAMKKTPICGMRVQKCPEDRDGTTVWVVVDMP